MPGFSSMGMMFYLSVMMSRHFMQFLMTEDSNLSLLVLGYLKNLIVANK